MTDLPPDFAEWLSRARAGSEPDVGRVLETYRGYLERIVRQSGAARLGGKCGVSDVGQEAMLEAYRNFRMFLGGTEPEVRAWLRQVLVYRMTNVIRRYATRKRSADEVSIDADGASAALGGGLAGRGDSPSQQVSVREQSGLVREALDRLPDDYRTVLVLRQQELLPFEEIGRRLGRTAHAARLLWLRALRRLQQEIDPRDPG